MKNVRNAAFLSLAFVFALAQFAPAQTESFRFRTPFVPTLGYAMFYVAQELYWPKLNLDGKALPGKGDAAAIQTVAAGSEQIGLSAIASVAAAIQQGLPIKIIAVSQRRDPAGLVFLKESGIKELKDIIGKRIGNFPAGNPGALLRVALKRAGIDEKAVQIVNVVPGGEVPLLLEKKIDAIAGFSGAQDTWINCQGYEAASIPFANFGLDMYGQAVYVNTKWAEQVGDDVITRALLGIIRGSMLVKRDTEQAIRIVGKLNPGVQIDRFRELSSLNTYVRWAWNPDSPVVQKQGWGWIDEAEMKKTQQTLLEARMIKKEIDTNTYYTNKYLQDPQVSQAAMEWARSPWMETPDDVKKKCRL